MERVGENKLKLAISNIAWSAEFDEAIYCRMQDLGYEGLEIAPTRIFPDAPYDHLEEAHRWAGDLKNKYGLSVPSIQSIWFGHGENIWNSIEERNELLEYTYKAIHFAERIGCRNLVFGCPKNRNMLVTVDDEDVFEFFYLIGEYAVKHGTVIGLEANPSIYGTNFINTTEEALDLINKVNSNGLRLNLDLGTMIANNECADVLKGYEQLVSHVHISEPRLAMIEWRTLQFDVIKRLVSCKYDNWFSIEMANLGSTDMVMDTLDAFQRNMKKYTL